MHTSVLWQSHQLTRADQFVRTAITNMLMHAKALKTPYEGQASWLFKHDLVWLSIGTHLILDMQTLSCLSSAGVSARSLNRVCTTAAHASRIICEEREHNDATTQHDMLVTGLSTCPRAC